jgi:hypothetical protein
MAMKRSRLTVITAFLLSLSSTAFAESAWDVLDRFGFVGPWAISCRETASPQSSWVTVFRDANGLVRRKFDRGPDRPTLMSALDSVQIITSTTIKLRIRNDDPNWGSTNGTITDVVMVKENSRVRTLESKGSDGKEYIKDGIVTSSGQPSPWLEKCGN